MGTVAASRQPERSSGGAFIWTFPGAPIRVALNIEVISRIRAQIDDAGTAPIAGLLLGQFTGQTVSISGIKTLPGQRMEDFEAALVLPEMPRVAGYYIAEPMDSIRLSATQSQIFETLFRDPQSVVLCIQTGKGAAPSASFFFWDSGRFLADFAFLEFPFDPALVTVGGNSAAGEGRAITTGEKTAPGRISEEVRRPWSRAGWVMAAMAACLLFGSAGVLGLRWFAVKSAPPSAPAAQGTDAVPQSEIGLRADRAGTDFRLTWNRNAPVLVSAVKGMISIQDGDSRRDYPLEATDLRRGSVFLATQSDRVQVRLSLTMPNQAVEYESVYLFLPRSGPPRIEAMRTTLTARGKTAMHNSVPESAQRVGEPTFTEALPEPPRIEIAQDTMQSTFVLHDTGSPASPATPAPPPAKVERDLNLDLSMLPRRTIPFPSAPLNRGVPERTAGSDAAAAPANPTWSYVAPLPLVRRRPQLTPMLRSMVTRPMTITVNVSIDENGVVRAAQVVPGPGLQPYLGTLAQSTAKMWRFKPAQVNGHAVPSEHVLKFQFKPE